MTDPDRSSGFLARLRSRWPLLAVIAVVLVFGLYYPVGMLLAHKIDDNLDYQIPATDTAKSGSRAVAMAAALIDREVNHTGWVANDPFFLPGSRLARQSDVEGKRSSVLVDSGGGRITKKK